MVSKIDELKTRINELKIWEYIEIKTCLIRLEPTDKWKVGIIRIQLLNYGRSEIEILLDHDNIKLIREVKRVSFLNDVLDKLFNSCEIEIAGETASLEYFTDQISFDFKDRAGMTNNYYVDSACYFLTRTPSNTIGLADIQRKLRLKLPKHTKPYEDLYQVCSLLLGVKFGGAYYPQILVFAPIFIKIDRFRLEHDNLVVYLYCSKRIRLEEFSVSAFGKDINDGLTFSRNFNNFKRLNNRSEIASSSRQITAKNTTSIKLQLHYKREDYYLEEYDKPFADSFLTSNLDKKEIQNKINQIKMKYSNAKSEPNSNIKGDLFEEVISELITTVHGLQVYEKDTDSGIEEIDLKVLNNNNFGIWNKFERIIFIECKNWSTRVDAREIRNFEGKIRNYFLHSGIFFAINGFKGTKNKQGALGQIKLRLKHDGFMIVPIDGTDIENIFKTLDLSATINEKWIDLYQ